MSAKLVIKGKKPTNGYAIEMSGGHEYKFGEQVPDHTLQKLVNDEAGTALINLAQRLEILGYDPATLRFSIHYTPATAPEKETTL